MSDLPEHITICSRHLGYHAYMAGPCFDTLNAAVTYRDRLNHFDVTWKSQDESWWELAIKTGRPVPEGVR